MMTIKSKFAAVALSLMIASPALAATGAAVDATTQIAPVQADVKADSNLQGQPSPTVDNKMGGEHKGAEHKGIEGKKMLDKDGKEILPAKDATVKSDTGAVVK